MSEELKPCPFESKWTLDERTSCWLWHGALQSRGYGHLTINGKNVLAHRFAYEKYVGAIPDGLTIDHLCRNRKCVNPAHLEPVSQAENNQRADKCVTTINSYKTHCPQGHEYTGDNLRLGKHKDGHVQRMCKTCDREYRRRKRNERSRLVSNV